MSKQDYESVSLRLKDAAAYLGISEITLWRISKSDPQFPKKIIITSRCCVYKKSDLDAYLTLKQSQS